MRLRCEYLTNPLGIDVATPRLSWVLQASRPKERGPKQTAYEVLVASSPERLSVGRADLRDTARLRPMPRCKWSMPESRFRAACVAIGRSAYGMAPAGLRPGTAAVWEMALLEPADWKAKWIGDGKAQPQKNGGSQNDPAPLFRKGFLVAKTRARQGVL